jgi:hypothetical protein
MSVPDDFPREVLLGAVSGKQPKLLVCLVGGRFSDGLTEVERKERYEACEDLAQQLAEYCARKASEHIEWSKEQNLARTERGMAQKVASGAWKVSNEEQRWIMTRTKALLGW